MAVPPVAAPAPSPAATKQAMVLENMTLKEIIKMGEGAALDGAYWLHQVGQVLLYGEASCKASACLPCCGRACLPDLLARSKEKPRAERWKDLEA